MEVEIPIIRSIPFVLRQYLAISVNIGFHNVSACRLNFHQYYRQLSRDVNHVFSFGGRAGGSRFLIDAIPEGVVFEFDRVIARPFGLPQLIIPVEGVGKRGWARIPLPQIGKSATRICRKAVDAYGASD